MMDEEHEGNSQRIKEALQNRAELNLEVAKWTEANQVLNHKRGHVDAE